MATKETATDTLTLIDGTVITVRPLKISLLRPFLKKFEGVAAVADDNEKSIDVLMECVAIAMEQYGPEQLKDGVVLEDLVDLPTVYKIVEVASGIKLDEVTDLLNASM